jgi:hypothetical protein
MPRKVRFGSKNNDKLQMRWESRQTFSSAVVLSAPDLLPIAYFLLILASCTPTNKVEAKEMHKQTSITPQAAPSKSITHSTPPAYTAQGALYGQTFFSISPTKRKNSKTCEGDVCEIDAATTPLELLEKKLDDKIIFYKSVPHASQKYKNLIKEAILDIAKTRENYCKLVSILENNNIGFKFKVVLKFPIEIDKNLIVPAVYDTGSNEIMIKFSAITGSNLSSFLTHEIHHAFTTYQNRKLIIFPFKNLNEPAYLASPCVADKINPKLANCDEVINLQEEGLKKVDYLLTILNKNRSKLTSTEKTILADYLRVIKNYQPALSETEVDEKLIEEAIALGRMDNQLRFTSPIGCLRIRVDDLVYYAYRVSYQGGKFIATKGSCLKDESEKAPLMDLKNQLDSYYRRNISDSMRTLEIDAVIFQILSHTPELLDFLFLKLREYHQQRSDETFGRCVI